MTPRARGHLGGTVTQGDVVKSEEALAAASMRGIQGLLAQVRHRLAPTAMVNA